MKTKITEQMILEVAGQLPNVGSIWDFAEKICKKLGDKNCDNIDYVADVLEHDDTYKWRPMKLSTFGL